MAAVMDRRSVSEQQIFTLREVEMAQPAARPLGHRYTRSQVSLASLGSILDNGSEAGTPESIKMVSATGSPQLAALPRPLSPAVSLISVADSLASSEAFQADELSAPSDDPFFVGRVFRRGSFGTMRHAVNRRSGAKLVCKCINDPSRKSSIPKQGEGSDGSGGSESTAVASGSGVGTATPSSTSSVDRSSATSNETTLAVLQEAVISAIMEGCENIVQFRGFQETPDHLELFFDYVEGRDFSSFIGDGKRLNEQEVRQAAQHIFKAVNTCHTLGIAHRDLKPENIMVRKTEQAHALDWGSGNGDRTNQRRRSYNSGLPATRSSHSSYSLSRKDAVVLIDFGSATTLPLDSRECGTYQYLAPEILEGQQSYDPFKADVFALGTLLFIMAFGEHPFPHNNLSTVERVAKMREGPSFPASIFVSAELRTLITDCLSVNPAARPTVAQLLENSWVRNEKFHLAGLSWRRLSETFKSGLSNDRGTDTSFSSSSSSMSFSTSFSMTPLSSSNSSSQQSSGGGTFSGLRRFSGSRPADRVAQSMAAAKKWIEAVRSVEGNSELDVQGKVEALRKLLSERMARVIHG